MSYKFRWCLTQSFLTSVFAQSCLAKVNMSSRSLYAITRPSCHLSICNVRAPYSGDWNFQQYFYTIWYLGGHLWLFDKRVCHAFSRDLTVLPANPHTYANWMELTIPAFAFPAELVLIYRPRKDGRLSCFLVLNRKRLSCTTRTNCADTRRNMRLVWTV